MIISPPCVVSLSWQLDDAQNRSIDALAQPTEFFVGGQDLLSAIEDAIAGQSEGFETQIQIEPEKAYGPYDPALVCFEPRTLFPGKLEPGMAFEGLPQGATTPDMPADAVYLVTEVYPEQVVLDANHPLAGMALRVKLKIHTVRAASDEEVAAGSVGGPALAVSLAPRVRGD